MENIHKIILALSLIKKGSSFNNSYKLITFFERKFRLNPTLVLKEIRDKGLVNYNLTGGIYYYSLSEAGNEVFARGKITALNCLEREYPEHVEILKALLVE